MGDGILLALLYCGTYEVLSATYQHGKIVRNLNPFFHHWEKVRLEEVSDLLRPGERENQTERKMNKA